MFIAFGYPMQDNNTTVNLYPVILFHGLAIILFEMAEIKTYFVGVFRAS